MKENRAEWAKTLGLFSIIVSELIGFTGAGLGLGYWLAAHWGAPRWSMVFTTALGLIVAMIRVYQKGKKAENNEP